jgi:hypothetical protein
MTSLDGCEVIALGNGHTGYHNLSIVPAELLAGLDDAAIAAKKPEFTAFMGEALMGHLVTVSVRSPENGSRPSQPIERWRILYDASMGGAAPYLIASNQFRNRRQHPNGKPYALHHFFAHPQGPVSGTVEAYDIEQHSLILEPFRHIGGIRLRWLEVGTGKIAVRLFASPEGIDISDRTPHLTN